MKNKEIIIAGLVALVFVILNKKRAFDSLELRPAFPRNFKLDGITNLTFDLPINAFNASTGTLNIGNVDLYVYIEKQYIGRAWYPSNQKILPSGASQLMTYVRASLVDIAAAVPNFANGLHDQVLSINLKGRLNVEGIYVNVDIPVNFNLPKLK
jgi:hypothetical protein